VAFLEVSIRWHRNLGFWFTFLLIFLLGFGLLEKLSFIHCWVKNKLCRSATRKGSSHEGSCFC
jgi:hypothetical protein